MSSEHERTIKRFEESSRKMRQTYPTIHIGEYVRLNGEIDGLYPHVYIGDYVNLGGGSKIITHCPVRGMEQFETRIDHDTFIGYSCIILPGVHIGTRCLIGAGSVVTKDILPDSVAAGNPARITGRRDRVEVVRTHLITKQGLPTGVPGKPPDWVKLTYDETLIIFDRNTEETDNCLQQIRNQGIHLSFQL